MKLSHAGVRKNTIAGKRRGTRNSQQADCPLTCAHGGKHGGGKSNPVEVDLIERSHHDTSDNSNDGEVGFAVMLLCAKNSLNSNGEGRNRRLEDTQKKISS